LAGVTDTSSYQGRGYQYGGPAFPGGILVGLGIGILTDELWGWLVVGIGAGFILMGLIAALARNEQTNGSAGRPATARPSFVTDRFDRSRRSGGTRAHHG
jgi:hypothetical protein